MFAQHFIDAETHCFLKWKLLRDEIMDARDMIVIRNVDIMRNVR